MEKQTRGLLFSADMFLFLASKYGLVHPDLPLYSAITKTESDFTDYIGKAILVLAYSYRPVFRVCIGDVFPLTVDSKDNMQLYVSTFAKITFRYSSPIRFLVVCCFISELCLYRFFNKHVENPYKEYIELAMDCFRTAYEHVLMKRLNHKTGWQDLKKMGTFLSPGYELLGELINEHPNNPASFTDSFEKLYDSIKSEEEPMRAPGANRAGTPIPTKAPSGQDSSPADVENKIPPSSKAPFDQEKSKSENRELAAPDKESASGSSETSAPSLREQNTESERKNEESHEQSYSFGTVNEALGDSWMEKIEVSVELPYED